LIYLCGQNYADMFTKVLGFFIFLFIFGMGFSMLIFLGLFVGYWLTLLGIEKMNPKLANKMIGHKD
jgi:hypothetical protein